MGETITSPEGWTLTIVPDAAAMGELAADRIAAAIEEKPDAVFSVPTGATPLPLFDALARRVAHGELDLSQAELFCLDDYLGRTGDDPTSLTGWLREAFLRRVNLQAARVHEVPAAAPDPDVAAADYDRLLSARGGLDLAVVGIGPNGHVAFNEPGSPLDSRTRVVTLTAETVDQAASYWRDARPMPGKAMTVGIANLLEARRIVLIATGEAKAAAIRQALMEPVGPALPASFLRLAGDRFTLIADRSAAAELE